MTLDEFRIQLEQVSQHPSAEDWWPEIEDLRQLYPHTISRLQHETSERYTCFMYAFRLHISAKHREICGAFEGSVFADTCFFLFLKKRGVLQRKNEACRQPGDLVVYINQGWPIHIGIAIPNRRVASKWGTGLLLDHAILEVPASYGKQVEAYDPPDHAEIERLFVQYGNFIGGAA